MKRPILFYGSALLAAMVLHAVSHRAAGHDDGRYHDSPLKSWFDSLRSSSGAVCCQTADGIADPQWESREGHYRVKVDDQWIDVPDSAVVKEPNRFQRSMVWPTRMSGQILIRCFLPGTLT